MQYRQLNITTKAYTRSSQQLPEEIQKNRQHKVSSVRSWQGNYRTLPPLLPNICSWKMGLSLSSQKTEKNDLHRIPTWGPQASNPVRKFHQHYAAIHVLQWANNQSNPIVYPKSLPDHTTTGIYPRSIRAPKTYIPPCNIETHTSTAQAFSSRFQ